MLIKRGKMEKQVNMEKERKGESFEGLFIPAGALIGVGIGFIYNNIPVGTLIGLGAGFLAMAIAKVIRR